MRLTLATLLLGTAAMLSAQTPFDMFFDWDHLAAMVAKAKKERKPDQANFVQPLLAAPPFHASLESRVQGLNTNPNVHEQDKEFIYVVEGGCKFTMGGKLRDERRTNAANRTGSSLEGGTPRHIGKGTFLLVPENTAHSFTEIEGTLVIISLHVPK